MKVARNRMKYETKRIVEEIDLICLTPEEYEKINRFYQEIISYRNPTLAKADQVYPIRRMILSDDVSRVEVLIAIDDKLVPHPPMDLDISPQPPQ